MTVSIREIDLAKIRDYSQQKEQAVIGRFFSQTKVAYSPFFVDVGAYDGITGSNSRFLAELDWGGIVIEPAPDVFARLQSLYAQRTAVTCVRCAVSDYTAEDAEMMVSEGPAGVPDADRWQYSQVSTLNPWFARIYVEGHGYRYRSVAVPVRPLTEILRAYRCPPDLGFLCIDCEGEDLRIIKALDFSQFQPRLLSLESDDLNRSVFIEFLETRGYVEYDHTSCNTFFHRRP